MVRHIALTYYVESKRERWLIARRRACKCARVGISESQPTSGYALLMYLRPDPTLLTTFGSARTRHAAAELTTPDVVRNIVVVALQVGRNSEALGPSGKRESYGRAWGDLGALVGISGPGNFDSSMGGLGQVMDGMGE